MGEKIPEIEMTEEVFEVFQRKLKEETDLLSEWFRDPQALSQEIYTGIELEACLLTQDYMPNPINQHFLKGFEPNEITHELSQFNFELNSQAHPLGSSVFSALRKDLIHLWNQCIDKSKTLKAQIGLFGILPSLSTNELTMENMTPERRYFLLSELVEKNWKNHSVTLELKGKDFLSIDHQNIMIESACTSMQIHITLRPDIAQHLYNWAYVFSAPVVALTANSPFLFGKDLWDENRVPVFENAVSLYGPGQGGWAGRVTFGSDYLQKSLFEEFLRNYTDYIPMLPVVFSDSPEAMRHLRLHNGTIWRWNRPIVAFDNNGKPHVRLEHRCIPSGPSFEDIIANQAFFIGLIYGLEAERIESYRDLSFFDSRNNFYLAAQYGLRAKLKWLNGRWVEVRDLLIHQLLPIAKKGLEVLGVNSSEISYYLDEIIAQRLATGKTGVSWQRGFIKKHGADFQGMTAAYLEWQNKNIPVHEWRL